MLIDYLVELVGPFPIYLDGIAYVFMFLLLMFGLWLVAHFILAIFSKFF